VDSSKNYAELWRQDATDARSSAIGQGGVGRSGSARDVEIDAVVLPPHDDRDPLARRRLVCAGCDGGKRAAPRGSATMRNARHIVVCASAKAFISELGGAATATIGAFGIRLRQLIGYDRLRSRPA